MGSRSPNSARLCRVISRPLWAGFRRLKACRRARRNGSFSATTPHITPWWSEPEAIRDGFYVILLALQGKRNTFYTGATWETQDSGMIWNFTEQYVLPKLLESLQILEPARIHSRAGHFFNSSKEPVHIRPSEHLCGGGYEILSIEKTLNHITQT